MKTKLIDKKVLLQIFEFCFYKDTDGNLYINGPEAQRHLINLILTYKGCIVSKINMYLGDIKTRQEWLEMLSEEEPLIERCLKKVL